MKYSIPVLILLATGCASQNITWVGHPWAGIYQQDGTPVSGAITSHRMGFREDGVMVMEELPRSTRVVSPRVRVVAPKPAAPKPAPAAVTPETKPAPEKTNASNED